MARLANEFFKALPGGESLTRCGAGPGQPAGRGQLPGRGHSAHPRRDRPGVEGVAAAGSPRTDGALRAAAGRHPLRDRARRCGRRRARCRPPRRPRRRLPAVPSRPASTSCPASSGSRRWRAGSSTPPRCGATSRSSTEVVHGQRLVWLDNAATTQKPQAVIDRLSLLLRARELEHPPRRAHAGGALDRRLRGGAREGAPLPQRRVRPRTSSSSAARPRASTWSRRAGAGGTSTPATRSSLTGLEHHANIVPWQLLCAETGARLRVAPVDDAARSSSTNTRSCSRRGRGWSRSRRSRTRSARSRRSREMIAIAHRYGARVLVDGAQAVSHMPVDVQALDADFYVFSGHKVFAPTGHRRALRQAGGARRDAAVAGRRQHDRRRHLRADHLPAAAAALRGRHRQHRRRGRARRRARLPAADRASRTSRATSTSCCDYAHRPACARSPGCA